MISGIFIAIALLAGWLVILGISATATMAIGAANPDFVVTEYHTVRHRFKIVETLVWLVAATVGSFVAAWVVGNNRPLAAAVAMAVLMIAVLWKNSWEARQRGLAMQILMTAAAAAGVVIGFALKAKFLKV
jgi:uncharacterized membrane protein YfcA